MDIFDIGHTLHWAYLTLDILKIGDTGHIGHWSYSELDLFDIGDLTFSRLDISNIGY